MPELPETTVISQDIAALAGGRRVVRAGVFREDVTNVGLEAFPQRLAGKTLLGTGRRGKAILLDFGGVVGMVHLVISGRVLGLPEWKAPDHTDTAVLELEGGVVFSFAKLWLGYFHLYAPEEVEKHPLISRLGPDPLSEKFSPQHLVRAFAGRKAAIKGLLLDQELVAGLGNIYADEILFASGIHPLRRAATLSVREAESLYSATLGILKRAIELRGTTFDSYHDAFGETGKYQSELMVFARPGQPCPRCGTEIEKIKVAGRGTHVCPSCQRV